MTDKIIVTEFPANPRDNTVFQSRQGLYFVYERASNAWVRVTGGTVFPLATPLSDGLMAAADLRKINRLYVPFPRATLRSDQCRGRFVSGNIDLFSLDDYVRIAGTAELHNAGRIPAPLPHKYRLTLHTSGFDFGINKDALIKYLLDHNQLTLRGQTGPRGLKGPRGQPGNKLPTGPKGPAGDPGTPLPSQLSINPDTLDYQSVPGATKRVVDIETQQTSSTTYVVVLKQGAIGNPDVNPDQLQINCGDNSTWVLAVAASSGTQSPIYYIDVFPILETIKAKYEAELRRLKAGHERIIQFWLSKLMSLFDAEKSALCCSLFNCLKTVAKIPKPRDVHPQPLLASVTSGNPPAPPPGLLGSLPAIAQVANPIATLSTALPSTLVPGTLVPGAQGGEGEIMLTVTGSNLGNEEAMAALELPPGHYQVVIDECCLRVGQQYAGDIRLIYNSGGTKRVTQFPRVGYLTQPRLAANAYSGLMLDINHAGGPVGAYYPASPDLLRGRGDNEGYVSLRFLKQQKALADRTCSLTDAHLDLFAQIWNELKNGGPGCGLVTRIAGQDYILVLPAEPASLKDVDCLARFGNAAVAWPTLDGESFLSPGQGPFTFKLDSSLNELVAANLAEGLFVNPRGCASVARVDGNIWVNKSSKQLIMESFVTVLFPIS